MAIYLLIQTREMQHQQNNNLIMHYKGDEELLARIDDYIKIADRRGFALTPFLTPHEQDVFIRYIGSSRHIDLNGGYDGAENKRICIDNGYGDHSYGIVILQGKYDSRYNQITHRDVLGAIMALQIKRNQIGDIRVQDSCVYIFVTNEISRFLMTELKQIKRANIDFEINRSIPDFHEDIKYDESVVSGMRLDILVGACCHLSRDKSKKLINSGMVKVNHSVLEDCSCLCNNNSVLSIRGYGRFIIELLDRVTKSGNLVVRIGKYR